MLHLNVGIAKALDALLQKLQSQVRLLLCQLLTDRLDEDGVVGRYAQTWVQEGKRFLKSRIYPVCEKSLTQEYTMNGRISISLI